MKTVSNYRGHGKGQKNSKKKKYVIRKEESDFKS